MMFPILLLMSTLLLNEQEAELQKPLVFFQLKYN